MATVPRRRQPSVREAPVDPGRSLRVSPPVDTSSVNQATQGLLRTGIVIDQAEQARKTKAQADYAAFQAQRKIDDDKTFLRDEDNTATKAEMIAQQGIKGRVGKNYKGATEEALLKMDEAEQVALGNALNPEQEDGIRRMYAHRKLSIGKYGNDHEFAEKKKYDEAQAEVYLDTQKDYAGINYLNPSAINQSMALQERNIRDTGKRLGHSKQEIERNVAVSKSQTHETVVRRMLADGELAMAEEYVSTWNKEILDDEVAMIAKAKKKADKNETERRDALKNSLYLRSVEGTPENRQNPLDAKEVRDHVRTGDLKASEAKSIIEGLTDVYNDETIPQKKRTAYSSAILMALGNLGAELNTGGTRVKSPLESGSKERIDEIRSRITGDGKKFITNDFQKHVLAMTDNIANDRYSKEKAGVYQKWMVRHATDPALYLTDALGYGIKGPGYATSEKAIDTLISLPILEDVISIIFGKKNKKMSTIIEELDNLEKEINPVEYEVGDIYTNKFGVEFKVVGHNPDGTIRGERLK